jgi:hypothetical protein
MLQRNTVIFEKQKINESKWNEGVRRRREEGGSRRG